MLPEISDVAHNIEVDNMIELVCNTPIHTRFPTSARRVLAELPEQHVLYWTDVIQSFMTWGNGSGKGQEEWVTSYAVVLDLARA